MGTYTKPFASPFRSHLQPMATPGSFWTEGGWVGPAAVQKGRNWTFAPQVAPLVVDGHVDDSGTPILGQGPAGAPAVRCLVDTDGTILQVLRPSWKQDDNMAGMGSFFSSISNDLKRAASFVSHTPLRIMLNPALQLRQGAQGITQVAQAAGRFAASMPNGGFAPRSSQTSSQAAASAAANASLPTGTPFTYQGVTYQVVAPGVVQQAVPTSTATPPINLDNAPLNPFGSPSNQAPVPVVTPQPLISPVTAPTTTPVTTPTITPVAPAATPAQLSASQQAWINQWQQDIVQAQTQGNTAAIAQLQAQIAAMQAGTWTGPMDGMGTYQSRQARLVRGQPHPAVYGTANPNLRAGTTNQYGRPHTQYSPYPGTRLLPNSSPVAGFSEALAGISAGMGSFLAGLFGLGEEQPIATNVTMRSAIAVTPNGTRMAGFVDGNNRFHVIISHEGMPGIPGPAGIHGVYMDHLGHFHMPSIKQVVEGSIKQPLKILEGTLKVAVAPLAATVKVIETGNLKAGLSVLQSGADNLKSAVSGSIALATGKVTSTSRQNRGAAAAGATNTTTVTGWPPVWTPVPGISSDWTYGDAGDGSGDGVIQNTVVGIGITATPAMLTAAGGSPAGASPVTVINQYLAANPTTASALAAYPADAAGLTLPAGTVAAPATSTGLVPVATATAAASTVGTTATQYNWPTVATAVPGFPAWTYQVDPAGSGGGLLTSTSLGRSFIVPPSLLTAAAGNPAYCVSNYEGPTGSPVAGSAAYYNWPLVVTPVPSNTAWTYVSNFDGTGNATCTYPTTGTTAILTPAMIMAAGGNPSTALANYLAANPAVQAQITAAAAGTAYGPSGAGYDGDTGSGATTPWDGVPGDPGDPNAPGGGAATGATYDANGNLITPGGGGGATPPLPAAPAPAGGLHWGWVAGAAVAVPGFLYLKAKGHI